MAAYPPAGYLGAWEDESESIDRGTAGCKVGRMEERFTRGRSDDLKSWDRFGVKGRCGHSGRRKSRVSFLLGRSHNFIRSESPGQFRNEDHREDGSQRTNQRDLTRLTPYGPLIPNAGQPRPCHSPRCRRHFAEVCCCGRIMNRRFP